MQYQHLRDLDSCVNCEIGKESLFITGDKRKVCF